MKLATYQDGSRDGQLVVVSRDLSSAHYATGIATRLQAVLDDWNFLSPQLNDLYVTLNHGKARHAFAFDARRCMAPLPRAYQWAEAIAYPSHAERLSQAAGSAAPPGLRDTPLLGLGAGDRLLGPCEPAWFGSAAWGIDFGAGLAVATGDVAMGASPEQALAGVRLLLLANGWRLRALAADEQARGLGVVQGWPAAAFGPVAVTPDELGEAWQGGRLQGTLQVAVNGRRLGRCATGPGMRHHFGQLIAHLAKTRDVRAGSLVGSGPVSSADEAGGCSSLAERRAAETLAHGAPRSAWLRSGDTVEIDCLGRDGLSVFGAIAQRVTGPDDLNTTADEDAGDGADDGVSTAAAAPATAAPGGAASAAP